MTVVAGLAAGQSHGKSADSEANRDSKVCLALCWHLGRVAHDLGRAMIAAAPFTNSPP